jgi:hypothetical protein
MMTETIPSKFEGESVEDSDGGSRLEQTLMVPDNLRRCAEGYNEWRRDCAECGRSAASCERCVAAIITESNL